VLNGLHECAITRPLPHCITDGQAFPIIPIRKNGEPWQVDCPVERIRNEPLRATQYHCRAFRKRGNWIPRRQPDRARMPCLKVLDERIAAIDLDRQTAEIHIRIALSNRLKAHGAAGIIRLA
jgi:hypothetical protein